MAEAILLTGKRGEGKTLVAVRLIERAMREGRVVATNINLFLDKLLPPWNRTVAYRLPDFPTVADLEALPPGNPNPTDEVRNGLLVLDECAAFLNSREWQGKERLGLVAWLAQSRKYGWDLILIAQHPRMVDAQIRDSLCELHGSARRLDKMRVPLLGAVWQHVTGKALRMPKFHVVTVRYGFGQGAPVAERWVFGGGDFYAGYDTLQKINPQVGQQNLFTYLPAWYLRGRYLSKWRMYRGTLIVGLILGAFVGAVLGYFVRGELAARAPGPVALETVEPGVVVQGMVGEGERVRAMLSNGTSGAVDAVKLATDGKRFLVAGKWYREAQ